MSAVTAASARARRATPLAPQPQRRLRVVEEPERRRKPKVVYALVALAGALAIGGAQMGLSIAMTQGSYEVRDLTGQVQQLGWERQSVQDTITGLSSPQYLAANASAMGMVIAEAPSYIRLSDAAILGTGTAAGWASSVDALARGAVSNALVAAAPLVTDPTATIQGKPVIAPVEETPGTDAAAGEAPAGPPALEAGLPSPATR